MCLFQFILRSFQRWSFSDKNRNNNNYYKVNKNTSLKKFKSANHKNKNKKIEKDNRCFFERNDNFGGGTKSRDSKPWSQQTTVVFYSLMVVYKYRFAVLKTA